MRGFSTDIDGAKTVWTDAKAANLPPGAPWVVFVTLTASQKTQTIVSAATNTAVTQQSAVETSLDRARNLSQGEDSILL